MFDLYCFYDSNPSGPLINRLKYFRIRFRFRQDVQSLCNLRVNKFCYAHRGVKILGLVNQQFIFIINLFFPDRCVHPSQNFSWMSLLKKQPETIEDVILTPRCAVWLRGVMHTVKMDFAVWCTPQRSNSRSDSSHGDWLSGGTQIMEYLKNLNISAGLSGSRQVQIMAKNRC